MTQLEHQTTLAPVPELGGGPRQMICTLDENFWNQLLNRMRSGVVIPVIGPGVVTHGPDDSLLHPWLARKVATQFGLPVDGIFPLKLQEIVEAQRSLGGTPAEKLERVQFIHTYLFNLLNKEPVHPGVTMYRLASIKDFQLFLTTTFDPLLSRAVEVAQPGGRPKDWVASISSREESVDLPDSYGSLPYACVYHLLGRIRRAADCAIWDDEALDFLRKLDQQRLQHRHLATALTESHLLFLGLSLDNWLLRFLVQVVKGKRLSQIADHELYLSDAFEAGESDQVVAFFSRLTGQLRIIPASPREFIQKLSEEWRKRNNDDTSDQKLMEEAFRQAHSTHGCIFVSYAGPDRPVVEFIVKQLQDEGLAVWFDKQQILPGQDFEAEYTAAVKEKCGIFLSIVSANTEQRLEAHNIRERNLANHRAEGLAAGKVFYIPVRIDEGDPVVPANEPNAGQQASAACMGGGHLGTPSGKAFVQHLRRLQLEYCKSKGIIFTPPPSKA